MKEVILSARQLAVGYENQQKSVLEQLDITVKKGELVCFLGPNGVGKSTLLRTLAGVQKPLESEVILDQKPLEEYAADELARKISVVLTDKVNTGNFTVFDLVSIGRYPHTGWAGRLSKQDILKVRKAIRDTHTEHLTHRFLHELSDGQLQKVMIARALAQDGELIILDEPTAHLDLTNRVEIMQLLKELAHRHQKAILVSTHELDLALQMADTLWLAAFNRPMMSGMPEELVLSGDLSATFLQQGFTFDLLSGRFRVDHEYVDKVHVKGEGAEKFWTQQALERNGFQPVEEAVPLQIEVKREGDRLRWIVLNQEKKKSFDNLPDLISYFKSI